jgi:hypothetical protein
VVFPIAAFLADERYCAALFDLPDLFSTLPRLCSALPSASINNVRALENWSELIGAALLNRQENRSDAAVS